MYAWVECIIVLLLFVATFCNSQTLLSIPLSGGAEEGEYTLTVAAGTPPQPFVVRVTTADSALLLPSTSCRNCKRQYRFNQSSTYTKQPCIEGCACGVGAIECGYRERYADGITVTGDVTSDTVQLSSIGNTSGVFVRFNTMPPSLYGSSTDGIFGLSQWDPSYPNLHLLSQVANVTNSSHFSLCLGEFGGVLVFGGYDPKYVGSDITWVPIRQNGVNFSLELTDMKIETVSIFDDFFNTTGKNCTNCVYATIDAGSQFLRLPVTAYRAVKALFQQRICMNSHSGAIVVGICGSETFFEGNCYILDDSTIEKFPTLYLSFGEHYELVIPPTNYLVDFGGKSCLAIEQGTGNNVVIGNRIIQEYYTIFEPSNNQVGFAQSVGCSGAQHRVVIMSGNKQHGIVGGRIRQPLVVKVIRLNDSMPVQGITVTFNVVDTGAADDVMWISEAIWKASPSRVDPLVVTTSEDGLAETYLWFSGTPGINTVTADTSLSLKHVIFTAQGDPSIVWRVLSYLFLAALIVVVIWLNLWYRRTTKKRELYRSRSSIINLALSPESRRNDIDDTMSPIMSPVFPSKKLDFSKSYENDDDDEDEQESAFNRNNAWSIRRSFKRLTGRMSRVFDSNS